MSVESIAGRVHSDRTAQMCTILGEGAELLIPPPEERIFKTSDIKQSCWFGPLRECLQESLDLGLFGNTTLSKCLQYERISKCRVKG